MSETNNYHLYLCDDDQERFLDWREKINGVGNSNMVKIDDALSQKADNSVILQGVLSASNWVGSESPFTQILTVSGLGADQNGSISITQDATILEREVVRNALLSVVGQDAGSLTIAADGEKPEIDIPVSIILGESGSTIQKGDAATIAVGSVTTGDAGTQAQVTNSGTAQDAVFDFVIPRGESADAHDTYELIETITVTEEVSAIQRTQEPDGTPYNFCALMVLLDTAASALGTSAATIRYYLNDTTYLASYLSGAITSAARYAYQEGWLNRGFWKGEFCAPQAERTYAPNIFMLPLSTKVYDSTAYPSIKKINIFSNTGTIPIPVGSKITIYGVRA